MLTGALRVLLKDGLRAQPRLAVYISTVPKCCSTEPTPRSDEGFKPVYKFPFIRGAALFNRTKLHHTLFSAVAVPSAFLLNAAEIVPDDIVTMVLGLSIGIGTVFYPYSYFFNRLVGIVYLNKDQRLVKISYLDFWGRRKDTEIPLDSIVPFSEVDRSITDRLFLKVKQYSSKNVFKLYMYYGGILENEGFNEIFRGD